MQPIGSDDHQILVQIMNNTKGAATTLYDIKADLTVTNSLLREILQELRKANETGLTRP